jgi:hypothetical protein
MLIDMKQQCHTRSACSMKESRASCINERRAARSHSAIGNSQRIILRFNAIDACTVHSIDIDAVCLTRIMHRDVCHTSIEQVTTRQGSIVRARSTMETGLAIADDDENNSSTSLCTISPKRRRLPSMKTATCDCCYALCIRDDISSMRHAF